MAQKANAQLQKTWRNRIARQRRSGQTIAQFCQQEGVSTPNLPAAGLVRPIGLASKPQHDQRADQYERWRTQSAVPADVALVTWAVDSHD